jgi:hypothetical protein
MKLIESKTLGTAAASIEFTSIPQDGTDLYITCALRSNRTVNFDAMLFYFNGVTTGYSSRDLFGTGSGVSANTNTDSYSGPVPSAAATADTFGNTSIYIPNYTGATNKSWSIDSTAENNATLGYNVLFAGLWSNTAAITSILFFPFSPNNYLAGSTISLYKITKGSDGIVTTS